MNQPQIYTCPLLPPPTPSHPSRLLQSTCFSSLSHTSNSHWLSILYMMECMFLNGKSNDEEPFCREWVAKKSALCTHFVLPGNWKLRMWRFSDFWHVCVCVCAWVCIWKCVVNCFWVHLLLAERWDHESMVIKSLASLMERRHFDQHVPCENVQSLLSAGDLV